MAQDANTILSKILHVVTQIRDNSSKKTTSSSKGDDGAKNSGQMSSFLGKESKPEDVKAMGVALKELAKGIGALNSKLVGWAAIPKKVKRSVIDFMKDVLDIIKNKRDAEEFKMLADGMLVLGEALPELAKGVRKFGIMQKMGLVAATTAGLTALYSALQLIGNPATMPLVLTAAAVLKGLGSALQGIASVLDSVAKIMLAFGASIMIMVGAIAMASALFGTTPLQSMLIIAGTILMLGAVFAGLGILGPLVALGGIAIGSMSSALIFLGAGLVSFFGGVAILDSVFNLSIGEAIKSMAKPIFLLGMVFAALGIVSPLIILGGIAGKKMGEALLWMSGGMAAMGLVGVGLTALTNTIGSTPAEIFGQMATGMLKIGLGLALLGLVSGLIKRGAKALLLVGAAIGIFALVVLGIGYVIQKLGGEEGLKQAKENISLLISGVLQGVIRGISMGLLGEKEDRPDRFIGKLGVAAKNAAILIGGIFLLMGVSYALTMFAFAVKAFTKAGSIRVITGYDKDGKAIFGDEVPVVTAGENIARSIGSFFTVLSDTFKDPSIIPSAARMAQISNILLGRKAARIGLFLKLPGTAQPSLLDAISGFAEVLETFADVRRGLPIYDKEGNITGYSKPEEIAVNIATSLSLFFGAFNSSSDIFKDINQEAAQNLALTLLGSSGGGLLGKIRGKSDQIGILEPIMKFGELLKMMGTDPNKLTYKDKDGNTHTVDIKAAASSMINNLVEFAKGVKAAVQDLDADIINGESRGRKKNDKTVINTLDELNEQFKTLTKQRSGLAKVSESIGSLSKNIGSLATELNNLDGEKLALVANANSSGEEKSRKEERQERRQERKDDKEEKSGGILAKKESKDDKEEKSGGILAKKESKKSDGDLAKQRMEEQQMFAESVGMAVSSALKGRQFTFDFQGENRGILTLD